MRKGPAAPDTFKGCIRKKREFFFIAWPPSFFNRFPLFADGLIFHARSILNAFQLA